MKRFMTYAKNRKGITIVMIALMLFVLLALLGLAVDIAYMYFAKNQLQVAADAAALAGAAELDGTSSINQSDARNAAWRFACRNRAASKKNVPANVFLVENGPTDCSTPPANLNLVNEPNGDIVVGNWDPNRPVDTRFLPTTSTPLPINATINAVKIVAARTFDPPVANIKNGSNPVRVFFGQVFRFMNSDWSLLNAKASALAARPPRPSTGLVICEPACTAGIDLSRPFMFNQQSTDPSETYYSISYTEFELDPPVGTASCLINANQCSSGLQSTCATADNTMVASFIWQERIAPLSCDPIRWDNGVGGARFDVRCAFESMSFDADNKTDAAGNTPPVGAVDKWRVIVPVSQDCPSGSNPGGTTPPLTYVAEIVIDDVVNAQGDSVITHGGTPHGILISDIECFRCGDWTHTGNNVVLVK